MLLGRGSLSTYFIILLKHFEGCQQKSSGIAFITQVTCRFTQIKDASTANIYEKPVQLPGIFFPIFFAQYLHSGHCSLYEIRRWLGLTRPHRESCVINFIDGNSAVDTPTHQPFSSSPGASYFQPKEVRKSFSLTRKTFTGSIYNTPRRAVSDFSPQEWQTC